MELLKQLYEIQSKSGHEKDMFDFLCSWLEMHGGDEVEIESDKKGNLYVTKGTSDTYPAVVAHMDQVQPISNVEAFMHEDIFMGYDRVSHLQAGLGADDKNGIWIALQCFLEFPAIKLAFFVEEEIGCVGSREANLAFFDNARFVIQCDRKGNTDFVSKACGETLCDKQFITDAKIEEFGYTDCTLGGLTDVKTLRTKGLKVCSCNISCGYYAPHTEHETTVISDLLNCLELVKSMIENMQKVYVLPIQPKPQYKAYCDELPFKSGHVKGPNLKELEEQKSLVMFGLKELLSEDPRMQTPFNFYLENRILFPNISYQEIYRLFLKLKKDVSK